MKLEHLQTEFSPIDVKPRFFHRLIKNIKSTLKYDTCFWRMSLAGPWGAMMTIMSLCAFGLPTGLGAMADIMLFMSIGTAFFFLAAHITAVFLAIINLPVPRLFVGSIIILWTSAFFIYLQDHDWAISAITATCFSVAGVGIGLVAGISRTKISKPFRTTIVFTLTALAVTAAVWPENNPPLLTETKDSLEIRLIQAEHPGQPGTHEYSYFTYGSGKDRWRTEFGRGASLVSTSVDASAYISKWPSLRAKYWGFSPSALPLNGRVWLPQGEGTFPLVLIVHGNHLSENFSDGGYDYLGKLLASRGFIAVSLDENFLNYSVWTGIPDNDMKARAWLLLKHLQQIDSFALDPNTPLYNKVDLERIALIGHSRGGQAVAMVKDAARWFADDATLNNLERYQIKAVVAIAPTDKKVDDHFAVIKDASYLTIQGARDGDVIDFDGDRQFIRTSLTKGSGDFKASLYIADANHSRFNTAWGMKDISYPKGIFLDDRHILKPQDQRSIAKVFISAFLETTLHDKREYESLFADYRTGAHWLPGNTRYLSRYEGSDFKLLASFDEDLNRYTLPGEGKASANHTHWKEEDIKNRKSVNKGTRGVTLEWNNEKGETASYSLEWKPSWANIITDTKEPSILSFSLSDRSFELDSRTPKAGQEEDILQVAIELRSANGESATLPLSHFMEPVSLPKIQYTLHPWLEKRISKGKYNYSREAIFQTYHLDLSEFTGKNHKLELNSIHQITFHFTNPVGKAMLDDIGIYS